MTTYDLNTIYKTRRICQILINALVIVYVAKSVAGGSSVWMLLLGLLGLFVLLIARPEALSVGGAWVVLGVSAGVLGLIAGVVATGATLKRSTV